MDNPYIHDTAIIESGVTIGARTKIWHNAHVMSSAKIGKGCVLGQNVFVGSGVKIGDGVKIQNNVSLFEGVICEDDVFLGPSMVFTNVLNPRSFVNRKDEFKQTIIRKGASIGANVTVVCGLELGAYCFIGAGAVVTKDVPPYALILGNPGVLIGWMSRAGERLAFDQDGRARCPGTGDVYMFYDHSKVKLVHEI